MALNTLLPFQDSFSLYNTAEIYGKWTVPVNYHISGYAYQDTSTIAAGAGPCNDNALQVVSGGVAVDGCGPSVTCAPATNVVYQGSWVTVSAFAVPMDIGRIQVTGTTDDQGQLAIRVRSNGTLAIVRGTGSVQWNMFNGTVLASSTRALQQGVRAFVEQVTTVHVSAGRCQVYVNGELWADTGAGVNTAGAGSSNWAGYNLGRVGPTAATNTNLQFAHFYLHDGSGASPYNGRLGPIRIEAINLLPTSDGALTGWTPTGGGTHFNQVNETPADTTTYVSATTATTKDSYNHGALAVTQGPIYSVQVVPYLSKDNAAFKQLDAGFRIAGVNYLSGLPVSPGLNSYAYGIFYFQNNPATAAAWTVSDVNGAQTEIDVVT
jgi:hypothetical protein